MTNRFKFRVGFTISFYDIAGNDVERQIILNECFSIDNGGEGITVHKQIIQEAFDIYIAQDEHKSAWEYINANYAETDDYYFIDSIDFIEQCTGLRDKNGKLIYEGDWLKTKDGYYCYVVWYDGFWWLKSLPSEAMDLEYSEFYKECEVIGNINENADLLENEELKE